MIIGTCGFTGTGSSAVSDYLKEFDSVSVIDDIEFIISYYPDGLEDLNYQLNVNSSKYTASAVAIERFKRHVYNYFINTCHDPKKKKNIENILDDFINTIVQVKWKGYGNSDYQLYSGRLYKNHYLNMRFYKLMINYILPKLENIFNRSFNIFPKHDMELSIKPQNFMRESQKFVHTLLKILGADFSKPIVLDQPFSGDDPAKSFMFFEEPIAIVVDRDPRDVYLAAKKVFPSISRQIPTDLVEDFVKYFFYMRNARPYKENNPKIMSINFEDMIYDYENTTRKIREFCNISIKDRKRTIFDPKLSINNTQVFKRFPEYKKDIEYIENNLKEYLYPFEKYPDPEISGKMFVFNPLNK